MQSTTIKPAQLMMEFMAGEQEKIGQGITSREFSRQLEEQHLKAMRPQEALPESLLRPQRQSASDGLLHKAVRKERTAKGNGSRDGKDPGQRLAKVRHGRSQPAEAEPTRQWKTAQQLRFADPMALEKVLNELQVAPDLRESLQSHSLLNGSVSLQQLGTTLDQALQAQDTLPTAGKVGAVEVRGLLESLQSPQNAAPGADSQLQLKAAGFYNLAEFRQLLQRVVEQRAQLQAPQNSTLASGSAAEATSAATVATGTATGAATGTTTGSATGKLTSQPETAGIFLARSLMRNGAVGAGSNPTASSRIEPGVVTGASAVPANAAQSIPANPASPEAVGPNPQAPNPAGMAAATPPGGTPNPAPTVGPHLSEGNTPSPAAVGPSVAVSSPSPAPAITPEAASVGTTAAMPTAMGLLKSLEGSAQAVIRGFHLEPEANRNLTNQSVTTDSVLNKTLTGELVEKIAAPEQGSAQTSDHQEDQQNLFAFARQNSVAAASGGTAGSGQTAGTPHNTMSSWAQALAERVLEMQKHKQSQLTLEVDSKDLGRVLLRVATEDNQVRATISTESEHARNMLHRGAPELRQQLEAQGLVLGQLLVDVQDRKGERQQLQQRGTQRSKDPAGARTTAAASRLWPGAGAVGGPGLANQIINVFA
jgi:flagellar hook-length control protein FliK